MSTLPHIEVLRTRLAPSRFDKYVAATGGDTKQALQLYEWNAHTSAIFYVGLGQFEVLLRNALDRQLVKYHKLGGGPGQWWNDPAMPFHGNLHGMLAGARKRAAGGASPATHGKVIAELMFGFWRLVNNAHHSGTLWAPALRHAFPHLRSKIRTDVYDRLDRLNTFRNRIAHYEPVHDVALEDRFEDLLAVAGWICPTTAAWIWSTSADRLAEALRAKP